MTTKTKIVIGVIGIAAIVGIYFYMKKNKKTELPPKTKSIVEDAENLLKEPVKEEVKEQPKVTKDLIKPMFKDKGIVTGTGVKGMPVKQ